VDLNDTTGGYVDAVYTNDGTFHDHLYGIENIIGSAGLDVITGDAQDNVIEGFGVFTNDTNDHDELDGGANTAHGDTISYEHLSDTYNDSGVTINLVGGAASYDTFDHGQSVDHTTHTDIISNFENVIGSVFDDTITGSDGDNIIEGMDGADILTGGDNCSYGDTVSYEHAIKNIYVNIGDSNFSYNTHTYLANEGMDSSSSTDSVVGFENIIGSHYSDILIGDTGDNVIEGLGNTLATGDGDMLFGNGGTDTISYEHFSNTAGTGVNVDLSTSFDQVDGQDVFHANYVGLESAMTDSLVGLFTNITGSQYADTLTGNDNANILQGLAGNDTLTGGSGDDIFQFASTNGASTITDFSSSDSDELQFLTTGDFSDMIMSWQFDTNTCTTDMATLLFCESDHTLYYDADGTGTDCSATAIATFSNNAVVVQADIQIVGP